MILTWPGKGLLRQIVMSSYPWDKPVSGIHAHRGIGGGGGLGLIFAGYVPLALRAPTPF